jgi:hypothetical protein
MTFGRGFPAQLAMCARQMKIRTSSASIAIHPPSKVFVSTSGKNQQRHSYAIAILRVWADPIARSIGPGRATAPAPTAFRRPTPPMKSSRRRALYLRVISLHGKLHTRATSIAFRTTSEVHIVAPTHMNSTDETQIPWARTMPISLRGREAAAAAAPPPAGLVRAAKVNWCTLHL